MLDPRIFAVVVGLTLTYLGGVKIVHGVKHVTHNLSSKLHHAKTTKEVKAK